MAIDIVLCEVTLQKAFAYKVHGVMDLGTIHNRNSSYFQTDDQDDVKEQKLLLTKKFSDKFDQQVQAPQKEKT